MNRVLRLALSSIAAAVLAASPAHAKALHVGDVAPEFQLKLVDGSTVKLSELRGDVVVLNFWATWCGPCRKELPLLDAYYRIMRPHGMRVYAVTTEDSVPASRMKALFAAISIAPARSVKGPYAILTGVPTNYVIDRAGVVRYAQAGAFDLATLNTVMVPLLNEKPPTPAAAPAPPSAG